MEKRAFEQTGLVPRSIIRTFDRFRRQLLNEAETSVIQEFRVSRYQVLVSVKCLVSLLIIPLVVNFLAKTFFLMPLTEYLWNTQQNEIFLNLYQENRAFSELHDFEEKLFFESLIETQTAYPFPEKIPLTSSSKNDKFYKTEVKNNTNVLHKSLVKSKTFERLHCPLVKDTGNASPSNKVTSPSNKVTSPFKGYAMLEGDVTLLEGDVTLSGQCKENCVNNKNSIFSEIEPSNQAQLIDSINNRVFETPLSMVPLRETIVSLCPAGASETMVSDAPANIAYPLKGDVRAMLKDGYCETRFASLPYVAETPKQPFYLENSLTQKFQQKTIELAIYYNQQSIEAITNLFGDFITFITITFLFIWMEPQIIILKSFLTESIYSLSDTTKSFLLILLTDLLVGFHSPRGWEIFIELILRRFGLPENQNFVFLFVATFPVLLDTVFKYWIFRYLNQISPSTVATYHNMIE